MVFGVFDLNRFNVIGPLTENQEKIGIIIRIDSDSFKV